MSKRQRSLRKTVEKIEKRIRRLTEALDELNSAGRWVVVCYRNEDLSSIRGRFESPEQADLWIAQERSRREAVGLPALSYAVQSIERARVREETSDEELARDDEARSREIFAGA